MKRFIPLFLLLVLTLNLGCRKEIVKELLPTAFVKLYPTDSSYRPRGCFQLQNGNYILYGLDVANIGVLPLIMKIDPSGKVIKQQKMPDIYHYLTLKLLKDGNMLAIGIENTLSSNANVCILDTGLVITQEWHFPIDSIRATGDQLPDFVEEENGDFTIVGYSTYKKYLTPFILRIDRNGNELKFLQYDSLQKGTHFGTIGIVRHNDGYSVSGNAFNLSTIYRGMYCLHLDENYNMVWDTIMFDDGGTRTVDGMNSDESDHSTIVCGTFGSERQVGNLYVRRIDASGNPEDQVSFYDYKNYATFSSISKTVDGGYILSGTVNQLLDLHLVSNANIYLLKLNSKLNKEWSRQFNSTIPYSACSAVQVADGGYMVSGSEHTGSYDFTFILIKTDAEGNIVPQ
ncbi:MAG: hypothetical protein WBB36_04805 [Chitinophagales bacterium]